MACAYSSLTRPASAAKKPPNPAAASAAPTVTSSRAAPVHWAPAGW
jgi:hypothetical protein